MRRFECFTAELHRLADWLQSCGVKTVALQSTGVYWIPLYDILEERGFEVYLVNAQHTKNLPGRKSDVQESQWLLKLHTYGLLNNSFQPPSKIRTLRTYWRQRLQHVTGAATCVQRMQKALTQMNSKRHPWAVWTRCSWVGMMALVGTKVSVHEGISGHFEAVTKRS